MRHAAVWFAQQVRTLADDERRFDAVFCTDMLNLAEFRGLAPAEIASLPTVVYFHESQLVYPDQSAEERDLHYAFTNFTTAVSADAASGLLISAEDEVTRVCDCGSADESEDELQ